MENLSLHFIINEMNSKDGIITDVNNAINAGIKVVHYNDKKLRKRQIVENAYILSALCRKNNVLFFMQDYPDVAALVGADGVHLTQNDFCVKHVRRMLGDDKVIGVNFTSLRQAVNSEEEGVNYIAITVENQKISMIIPRFRKLREIITIPIIAMGELSFPNIKELFEHGLDGVAMLSHLYEGNELQSNIKETLTLLHSH